MTPPIRGAVVRALLLAVSFLVAVVSPASAMPSPMEGCIVIERDPPPAEARVEKTQCTQVSGAAYVGPCRGMPAERLAGICADMFPPRIGICTQKDCQYVEIKVLWI